MLSAIIFLLPPQSGSVRLVLWPGRFPSCETPTLYLCSHGWSRVGPALYTDCSGHPNLRLTSHTPILGHQWLCIISREDNAFSALLLQMGDGPFSFHDYFGRYRSAGSVRLSRRWRLGCLSLLIHLIQVHSGYQLPPVIRPRSTGPALFSFLN